MSKQPDNNITQPAANGWPVPAKAAAIRMIKKPVQVTILGVIEVLANKETMGWVTEAWIALRNTCSFAVDVRRDTTLLGMLPSWYTDLEQIPRVKFRYHKHLETELYFLVLII
jgi:hypothetical protein